MGDENRFNKLELRPGVRPSEEETKAEKTRKERLQELDLKFTLDATIDQALKQEEINTFAFYKRIKTVAVCAAALCAVFFLAAHGIFGFDGFLGLVIKACFYVVLPVALFRWVLSHSN